MNKIKSKITVENLLCLFVILNPVLDILSFLVRNNLGTAISPATILRPIIPAILMIYLFFKNDKKFKIKTILIGIAYIVYTIIHLNILNSNITNSSFGGIFNELQYNINYTFMILNLFLFTYTFKEEKQINKLKKAVVISGIIYIGTIYLAIITRTSSHTYMHEGIGYKGWFESGNSLSAILIFLVFIYLSFLKNKKYLKIIIPIILLIGIFMTFLIGTRTGLLSFIIAIITYIIVQIVIAIIKKVKINKKVVLISSSIMLSIIILIGIIGSSTFERREYIDSEETKNYLTGDLTDIKNHIDNGTLDDGFMSEVQKQTIIDLYNTAKELDIDNTDQRMQQLIYNVHLVGNQANIASIIFGNGYVANYRELVFEMEIPAILFNFGIIGFLIYLGPFIGITFYGIYIGIKNIKKIDEEYSIIFAGIIMAYGLSILTGYVFFNISSSTLIIILSALFLYKIRSLKLNEEEEKTIKNKRENEKTLENNMKEEKENRVIEEILS